MCSSLRGPGMTPSNQHALASGTSLIRTLVSLGIAPTIEKGYPYKEFPQGWDRGFEACSRERTVGGAFEFSKVSAVPMSSPVPDEKRHRTALRTKAKK